MKGPLVFADLDDTLFQTARKCPGGTSDGLRPMSRLADGTISGFATSVQQELLGWLRRGSIIPVTARSSAVLARVDIEQTPAICSNGGRINSADGAVDREWHGRLLEKARTSVPVFEVHNAVTNGLDAVRFRHWMVAEDDLELYFVVKSNVDDGGILQEVAARFAMPCTHGWRMHRNGNNLAFMPPWLGKRNAVAHLLETMRREGWDGVTVGVGDSASDAGFMDLCEFAMTPTGSQLWRSMVAGSEWLLP